MGNDAVGSPPSANGSAPLRGNHRHRAAAAAPTTPFLLAMDGVRVEETGPWRQDSIQIGRARRKFSVRPVSVNGNGKTRAAAAAAMRSRACPNSKIGASGLPLASEQKVRRLFRWSGADSNFQFPATVSFVKPRYYSFFRREGRMLHPALSLFAQATLHRTEAGCGRI
jgi:hypothetical protein